MIDLILVCFEFKVNYERIYQANYFQLFLEYGLLSFDLALMQRQQYVVEILIAFEDLLVYFVYLSR